MERLTKLKAGRMKQLVLKRRAELEEICRMTHIEADPSTAPEKSNALIDSGKQVLGVYTTIDFSISLLDKKET